MKVKDFLEFLKLPPNILFAISLVTGMILFLPKDIVSKIYMLDFRNKYGFIISIVFLLSSSILVAFLISIIYKKIKEIINNKLLKKSRIKYLLNAEPSKVRLIKEFIKQDTHTMKINSNDGLTVELSYYGLISTAGNTQAVDFGYSNEMYLMYFLQPWVINLIKENEDLRKKYIK